MTTVPEIVIFVRHSSGCKGEGDGYYRKCDCRKFLRWTQNGKQHKRPTGTRSWVEAEKVKRDLEDQLSGKTAAPDTATAGKFIQDAVETFIADKTVQGVTAGVLSKYRLELARLKEYCFAQNVLVVSGISRELLTGYAATWTTHYPSSNTRAKVRERCSSFLRYCHECQWTATHLKLPKVKVDEPPTMPLTAEEYARLLDALYTVNPRRWDGKLSSRELTDRTRVRVRAVVQLMRWSGLAIQDALTLERAGLFFDGKNYRVVTARQKTGTDVSVVLPPEVAAEILAVQNGNPKYIFWTGESVKNTVSKTFTNRYIRPLFDAAGLKSGHMVSHRLRDTFAVHLLQKGVPLPEVSKALGHTSIKTTEKHYAAWVPGRQERLDGLIAETWEKPRGTMRVIAGGKR